MKKKSILLTCIVAIMALAMFVGCDNAPTLPSFVVSGSIDQTGDFLTGQNFDPKKFSVTVTYDNGKIVPADETVSVYLKDGGQKVYGGEVVMADLGKNYESQPVTAKGTVSVYNINRIEVAGGPESYVSVGGENPVIGKASDYTVTAYYYDSDNVEKSMLLGSTEYSVYWDEYVGIKPSASNPSATGKLGIDVNVGGSVNVGNVESVTFTEEVPVTFQAADVDFEFTEIASIEVATNKGYIIGFGDAVADFDLFDIKVSDGENNSIPLTSDPGLKLSFVDGTRRVLSDISKESSVYVKAEFEGCETFYSANPFPVATVTISIEDERETTPAYTHGAALPALTNSDFSVEYSYKVGNPEETITRYVDSADVEFAYSTSSTAVVAPGNGVVPANGDLYIVGTYRGILGATEKLTTKAPTYEAVYAPVEQSETVDQVVLAETYSAPVAQNYNTDKVSTIFALDTTAVEEISFMYTEGKKDAVPVLQTVEGTDKRVSVKYTTDTNGTALVAGPDALVGLDTIYIEVTFEPTETAAPIVYYEPVKLGTAYAESLRIDVEYANKNADGNPMYGTAYTYTVNAVNGNGVVAVLDADEYTIDGTLPETVTAELATDSGVDFNAIVDSATGPSKITGELTLKAPVAYVECDPEDLTLTVAKDKTVGPYLVDSAMSTFFGKSAYENYAIEGFTPHGTATVTIDNIIYLTEKVLDGDNTIYAYVSYTDAEGNKQENVRVLFTFEGVAYVEDMTANNISFVDDEGKAITTVAPGSYTIDDFIVAETSYKAHGEDVTPTVTEIKNQNGYVIASSSQTNFSVGNGTIMTLTVSYTNDAGETVPVTATQTITCSNV